MGDPTGKAEPNDSPMRSHDVASERERAQSSPRASVPKTESASPSDSVSDSMVDPELGSVRAPASGSMSVSDVEPVRSFESADPALPPNEDLERAHKFAQPVARFMKRWRAVIKRWPWLDVVYKAIITVFGVAVVLIGIILIPLPGPGWLIVFIGLTILGSEFHWARRLTNWARMQLSRFWEIWRSYRANRAEKKSAKRARKEARRTAADEAKRLRGL